MIKEIDKLEFPTLRKGDDSEDDYELDDEQEKEIRDSMEDFLVAVGAAIIAAQQSGLMDAAHEGARAAGGRLTPVQIKDVINAAADFNAEHFAGLKEDALAALNQMLDEGNFSSAEDLSNQLGDFMDTISSRAERYGKGGGNAAWSKALRLAGEANGDEGGIWDCNFGPGSCPDCEGLHGEYLSWDEFENTYQNTECDGGCNCGFHSAANPESLLAEDIAPEGDPLPSEAA